MSTVILAMHSLVFVFFLMQHKRSLSLTLFSQKKFKHPPDKLGPLNDCETRTRCALCIPSTNKERIWSSRKLSWHWWNSEGFRKLDSFACLRELDFKLKCSKNYWHFKWIPNPLIKNILNSSFILHLKLELQYLIPR